MPMNNAEDHDRVRRYSKKHAVWKTMDDRPASCAVDLWKTLGPRQDLGNGEVDLQREFLTEPCPLSVEPLLRLK